MPNAKHSDLTGRADAYRERVLELKDELGRLRESSFNSTRDLKASQAEEQKNLAEKHKKDLEDLSERYEKKLQQELRELQMRESRIRKDEIKSALDQAHKKWTEDEENRFREFKVELVHAKSVELAEQEAYWRAELTRICGLSDSNARNRRKAGGAKSGKRNSEKGGGRTLLAFCGLIFVMSAGTVLYLFSSQGNSSVKPILYSILSVQDAGVRDSIYKNAPWLKSHVEQEKPGSEREATVRTSANLREGPNLGAGIIRVLEIGVRVHVVEVRDGWSFIRIDGTEGKSGWIHNSLLEASK